MCFITSETRIFIWGLFLSESEKAETEETKPEEEIKWTEDDLVAMELVVATGNTDEVKKVKMSQDCLYLSHQG